MEPQELTVFDEPHPCSYLPERTARLPLRFPQRLLTRHEFDQRLLAGDRRTGILLYRAQCPACCACEPIRLDLERFKPNATQRRIFRRGQRQLTLECITPVVDDQRVALFNLHRQVRGLEQDDAAVDQGDYAEFLTDTCCETWEMDYRLNGELVAVAIVDAGRTSLSAVYCYYHPERTDLNLGTYSILQQVELCRETGRRYLYLGLYIAQSTHMAYKARFHPHERLINGQWQEFA